MKVEDKGKKRINNKGFTLVELLATISILAIIMLMAIPNVVGIVQKGRNKTYIEDAKKMVVLAKYKVKTDVATKNDLKNKGHITISLKVLDQGKEIKDAPNGGEYDRDNSYVKIEKSNDKYEYYVTLFEDYKGIKQGLQDLPYTELLKDNAYKNVKTFTNDSNVY